MPISIHLRGPDLDAPQVEAAVASAYAWLREVDRLFSTYRADSEISRIRSGELDVADADPLVWQVVALCHHAEEETGGTFTARLPDAEGRVRFDPTGLVKGWAVEQAATHLAALTDHAYCLNAGGDVSVGGSTAVLDGTPWRVGIEDPRDRSTIARVVELAAGGVATSGTAARGAHLYDPTRRAYVDRSGSVSVVGPSVLWADVWATALYVGPPELTDRLPAGYEVVRL
ncbi:FAD:protein FMN transferase [Luteipulveratus sp. YIM 133132]|uniref:FAD:protein FMN transferase n=1 Tax=Luteipulveratus flavus TaxID=3031728 RepID=UPI0023B0C203|nr:FAD:protein FMN transferase [Luteipulveratus sp. YIM 133132]MDE9365461.1 FAD:protein FMN transferase [Luteipulveratus sp. YIM 133132]